MNVSKRGSANRAAWRSQAILIVLVVLAAGGGAAWYLFLGPGSARSEVGAGSQTYTSPVKRGDITLSAAGAGKLVAYQSADLNFSVGGTVADVSVETGDVVSAGQVLANLAGSQTLEASLASAKLQVLQAQKALTDLQQNATLAVAQAYVDLLAAQDSYDSALDKSQRVLGPRCGETVNARNKLTLDRALDKLNNLTQSAPGSDLWIAARQSYDTALANYNACIAYTADEKASAQAALEVAKTTLQTAQSTYDTLKAASGIDPNQLALDEANLKAAQAQQRKIEGQLAGTILTAPFAGKVTYLAAKAGAVVSTGTFITIADISRPTLEISVDESDINALVLDAPVTVAFDALADQSFSGKVTRVDPQMTQSGQYRVAKGLVELNASVLKTLNSLPLGASASLTILNQQVKDVLMVPLVALKTQNDGSYAVMVQDSDGQLALKPVTIGIQDKDYVEIKTGLSEGEQVSTGTMRFIASGATSSSSSLKNVQNSGNPFQNGGQPPAP